MPFNSRDLWVVLKAQDMATRALNAYSRSVRKSGSDTRLAQIEAAQGALRAEMATKRLAQAYEQAAIKALMFERAENDLTLAILKENNASIVAIHGVENRNREIDQEILQRRRNISAIDDEVNGLRRTSLAYDEETKKLRESNQRMAEHRAHLSEMSNRYKAFAQTAYAASFAITAVGVVGATALYGAIDAAAQYDTQVRKTFTQVDHGKTTLKELGDIGVDIATKIGIKFEDVQGALYDVFSSMTVTVQEAKKDVELFAKAAVAGQTDIQSVSRGTIGILNSFHLSASDLNHILDVQFEFIRKGIGTYDEWAQKIGLVSPSAVRAGQSIETMMAFLAEGSRQLGNTASTTASVGRLFDAFTNAKAIAKMKALGVSVTDAKGNFRNLVDVLFDLRTALDKIKGGPEAKAAALQDIFKSAGGTQQMRRLLNDLLLVQGNLEDLKAIQGDVQNSTGALNDAYKVFGDNAQTQTQLLKNKFHALYIELGHYLMPYFMMFVDWLQKAVDWFRNLSPHTKDILSKMLGLAVAAALVIGPILGILGAVGSLSSALAALGLGLGETLAVIAGVALALIGYITAIVEAYKHSKAFRDIVALAYDRLKALYYLAKDFAQQVADAFKKHLLPALQDLWKELNDKVLPILKELWDTYGAKVISNLLDIKNAVVWMIDKGFVVLSAVIENVLIPAIDYLTQVYHDHRKTIDLVIRAVLEVGKWMAILATSVIGGLLLAALIDLIVGISLTIIAFATMLDFIINWGKRMVTSIRGTLQWIKDKFDEIDKQINGKGKFDGFLQQVLDLPGKIKGYFADAKNWLESAGEDIVNGLINGLVNAWPALIKKFSDLAQKLPKPIRDALQIGSPSKVFARLGRYTVQGFIKGVEDMTKPIDRAMSNLSSRMVASGSAYLGTNYGSGYNTAIAQQGRGTNVTVNVTTQEIRPKYHAAQLGTLIAGRVGG